MVDGAAGDVEQPLAVADQERDHQRRATGVQVNCPRHLTSVGQLKDIAEKLQQFGFTVGYSPGQHLHSVGINHRAVVLDLACVRPCPEFGHPRLLIDLCPGSLQTTTPTCPYEATARASQ